MKLGIVGLPNVGKSTLFNAITKAGAESANYPFCTIDPNVGVVAVPDERLKLLSDLYHSEKITPAVIEFCGYCGVWFGALPREKAWETSFWEISGKRMPLCMWCVASKMTM